MSTRTDNPLGKDWEIPVKNTHLGIVHKGIVSESGHTNIQDEQN